MEMNPCLSRLQKFKYLVLGNGITAQSYQRFIKKYQLDEIFMAEINNFSSNLILGLKSPGIDDENEEIKLLENQNILRISDLDLYYLMNPSVYTIVVTGTFGKSTTTSLLYEVMKRNNPHTYLCGNIGNPILDVPLDATCLIIEASSFMLKSTHFFVPDVYCCLNLYPHHLDYHKTMSDYCKSKIKITERMHSNQEIYLPVSEKCSTWVASIEKNSQAKIHYYHAYQKPCKNQDAYYSCLTGMVEEYCSNHLILTSLLRDEIYQNFSPLPYRYQVIKKDHHVIFINDSKSTSLRSFYHSYEQTRQNYPKMTYYCILEGVYKEEEEWSIFHAIHQGIFYVYGKNRKIIQKKIHDVNPSIPMFTLETLEEVELAISAWLQQNVVILFSPGLQSFADYDSFTMRGKHAERVFLDKEE